jgi:antitoxin component YwqK of YwqJK toxin-antitoxin module
MVILKEKFYYKKDKLEGKYTDYYESGKIFSKCYYKNGKKEENVFIMKMEMVIFIINIVIKMEKREGEKIKYYSII